MCERDNLVGYNPMYVRVRIMHMRIAHARDMKQLRKIPYVNATYGIFCVYKGSAATLCRGSRLACSSLLDSLVDAACYTKEEDACCADSKSELCVAVALECWECILALVDVHSLDDKQVVVE